MNTLITAHSGADGTPDNTVEYITHTLSLPVDALEVDVRRLPSTGEVTVSEPAPYAGRFVRSDPSGGTGLTDGNGETGASGIPGGTDRVLGDEPSAYPGLSELILSHDAPEGTVPSLREAMRMVAAHPLMVLNCDLKEPWLEEPVCALALECGLAGRLVLSGTVSASLCRKSSLLRRTAKVYLNIEDHIPSFYLGFREIPGFDEQAAREALDLCAETGARMININQLVVTRRFIEMLEAKGVGVSAWTVDEPSDLRWFLSRGVGNITTRNIAAALALRGY